MRILAVDYGTARTGLAISDPTGTLASPLCVLNIKNRNRLIEAIKDKVAEYKIEKIIIGSPKRTDGRDSEMQNKINDFAELLFSATELKPEFINETYTTVIAAKKLHENQKNSKQQKSIIDSAAAAVFLQDYLDKL